MRISLRTLLPVIALITGCANMGSPVATTDEPLYMRMSDEDVHLADATVQQALESQQSGSSLYWRNSTTGHYGAITPQRTYRTADGTYCREYREQLTVGTRSATYTDQACRGSNGLWIPI